MKLTGSAMTLAVAGLAVFAHAPAAQAQYLGSTLSWQYYAYGGPYTGVNIFVDNGGVDGTFFNYFNILSDNNSITFDYLSSSTWSPSVLSLAPTIHNGIAIRTVSAPAFTSVTIDPATTMTGFDASRVSFTNNEIQVDWQNLSFVPGTVVKLDLNGSNVTPEPGTYAMLGSLGLTGAAFLRRRRGAR